MGEDWCEEHADGGDDGGGRQSDKRSIRRKRSKNIIITMFSAFTKRKYIGNT